MRRILRALPLLFPVLLAVALNPAICAAASLEIEAPPIAIASVKASVKLRLSEASSALPGPLEIRRNSDGLVVATAALAPGQTLEIELAPPIDRAGYSVAAGGSDARPTELRLRVISGWLTILPPILAILLALVFRQVVPALLAGVWIGAWIVHDGAFVGLLRTVDQYVVEALSDTDHVSIIVFTLLLGGMVGVISRSGGTVGLVRAFAHRATTSRRGQLVTWLLGTLIFFDDYANTLLVGNTMRPVTDRLKISREKLAYIVDSTAAPIASVALISTWIGYEVSLIGDSLEALGSDLDPYSVFVASLPYRFYPILALLLGLLVAASGRDFGPMLRAERRALGGKLLGDSAVPLADFDHEGLQPIEGQPQRWFNAIVPILVVLLITFVGLWLTGRASLVAEGSPRGDQAFLQLGLQGVGAVFGAGNSFKALLWASFGGCLSALALAIGQRILTLGEGLGAWINGMKSMVVAFVILVLAWSISDVCSDLNTAGYMVASLSDRLDPRLLPVLIFALAAMVSFATGTSWGTMGILIPLAVPTTFGVAQAAGFDPATTHGILLGSVSSVLAGSIFGDHCSPISDTTVLSSMASGCDHVDHVRTQLPYALLAAGAGMLLGDLPSAFGVSPFLCLLFAGALIAGVVRWVAKPVTG